MDTRVLRGDVGLVLATLLGVDSAPKLRNLTVIPMMEYRSCGAMVTLKDRIFRGDLPSLQRM